MSQQISRYIDPGSEAAEVLNIAGIAWAARQRSYRECDGDPRRHRYEFIGPYTAFLVAGLADRKTLATDKSGEKCTKTPDGSTITINCFTNDVVRAYLWLTDGDADALDERIARAINADTLPQLPAKPVSNTRDPMTTELQKLEKLVEPFPAKMRVDIYRGISESGGNGWQLLESFPWLAVRAYIFGGETALLARDLIKRGTRTRDIAAEVGLPMAFKRFVPGSMQRLMPVHELLNRNTQLVSHHCPQGKVKQNRWLRAIDRAAQSGDEEFAVWTAIHWLDEGLGGEAIHKVITELTDWVSAGTHEQVADTVGRSNLELLYANLKARHQTEAAEAIKSWLDEGRNTAPAGRLFNRFMAPLTVHQLSEEWHVRIAEKKASKTNQVFPEPWLPGATLEEYRIEPVTDSWQLGRYAYSLRNCAASYIHKIIGGKSFMYVVFRGEQLIAMLELERNSYSKRIDLSQLKGPRNQAVEAPIREAVDAWFGERVCNGDEFSDLPPDTANRITAMLQRARQEAQRDCE